MSKHNACDTVRVVRAIAQTKKHTHLFTFLPTFFENIRVYVRERRMKRSAANPPAALSVQSPLPLSSQLHRCTAFFFPFVHSFSAALLCHGETIKTFAMLCARQWQNYMYGYTHLEKSTGKEEIIEKFNNKSLFLLSNALLNF